MTERSAEKMRTLKQKISLARKLYISSYPGTYLLIWLATFDPEPAGAAIGASMFFLAGLAFGFGIAIYIFFAEIKCAKKLDLKQYIIAAMPIFIWAVYFYIMGFTSLGDNVYPV